MKALWKNTNGNDKALQVLLNLVRKQALIHVLSGGYWFRRVKDGDANDRVALVKIGKAAAAHLLKSNSLARKLFDGMTSNELPDTEKNPLAAIDAELMVCKSTCIAYNKNIELHVRVNISREVLYAIWISGYILDIRMHIRTSGYVSGYPIYISFCSNRIMANGSTRKLPRKRLVNLTWSGWIPSSLNYVMKTMAMNLKAVHSTSKRWSIPGNFISFELMTPF